MRKRVLSFLLACFMIVSTIVVSTPHIYVNAATIANGTTWTMKSDFDSTLNDGVFTLKALNRTTNEIITPVWSDTALDWNGQLTDKWQATVPCWEYNGTVDVKEAFVFCLELNETILTSMPLKTYDENGGVVYIAAAIAFTAPADGVYKIEANFKQHHGSGGSDRMQTYSIVYGTQVIDTKTSVTGGEVSISGEVTIKEGDIAWIIHEVEPESSNFGGLGADVNEIKVTKTADPEIIFTEGVNQWTLPMDWSTGLKTENTGNSPEWDIAEKGNWKLTVFTNPSDISTIVSAPASGTAASATNTGGVGPKPYIESANNANHTYGAVNNTNWYVNAGARWRDVIFAKGNNSSFMKVGPRNFPAGNSPTVVFTAPEDGLYSYSELVTGVKFADANGAAVIATATVRKNGLVIDSFTPTADAATKTLKGTVVLEEGDLLMFTFTLNTAANIKDCDSSNEQVFELGNTVVCKIGNIPAEYAEIDHTPTFAGDSATSIDGNTVLKGYDVDADTFYDVEMQAHPNPDESDKWIAYDPKATNSWDNGATAWDETLYYGRLWSGVKNGAITGVGGSQQYKSGAALVFTVPNDGLYAISARFTNGNLAAQPSYSDFVITVNGEVVSTQTNYSAVKFTSEQAVAIDVSYFGELKANDEVVIMKKPNANTTVCNTSNDGDSTIQITEIKNLPTNAEEKPVQAQTWDMPTAWRTELDKDDNGWDLASKNEGLWRLTSFADPSDVTTMRWAPSTDKLSNATSSNHQELSPESYIESKDNRAQFSSEKTYWYVNYGHRYQMKAFHGNDGEDFFYAIPGNDSSSQTYNHPTIVFTAPVTGTYDFTELATLNVSGATVTATVRKNGIVLKTADLNADGVTLAGDVQLDKGDLLMFTYTLTNSFDATDNTMIVKISDVSVSVRGTGSTGGEGGEGEGGEGGEGEGGETPTPIDPILGETIGGGTGATGGVAEIGSKWDLPTDFYTGMTSAGEKKNGNWQLATYDLTTLKTYYKFGAPAGNKNDWYFQATEPYDGQYGTFAYSSRGFETNPGSESHPEVASVIIFTAPADGLYKFNADTFSYGASKSGAGSRAVIFYVMKDGVIYAITNPSYLTDNTESLNGYIALKQGEQIYFCAQRYTHYTHSASDWPAWIGARYEALSVEKVAELTSGDELATRWHFTPDGSGLAYGHFEMKGYDFVNKTVTDATFNSGSDWKVTSASGNVLFWKSSETNSVCGWGPDGSQTNKDEGAAIVFTAPTDGTYNVTGHFEKTYVKSSNGKHYCDYKVILEDGTVVFDGTNYDESATESFSGLTHTLGASVELKQGDKIYIVKSPNESAVAGAQGGEIYSVTVTRVATITPPAPPDVRPPYEEIPTAIGTSFDLPMNWWSTGVFDENGWELARQGQWRLTSFANPDKVDSIRFDGSKAPIGSNVANDKAPWSYIETLANRATISGGKPSQWYVNYESRWSPGTAFTMGDDQNYMLATPASGSRSNNPAVVFIAPDDGSYSYKHFVELGMFDKGGVPVTTSVTVRVNGEVVETFVPSANTPSKTMHGLLRLKAGDVVAFVYSLTSNAAVANHDPVIKVGHANITKVDDYVDTNGHHCYGGTATCTTPAICEGCQQPYGKVDLENHVPQCTPTYNTNATTHTEFWSECGQTLDPEKHTWVEGVCAVCDYACQHPGDKRAATCISGAICNECEMAHGDKNPNAHVDGLEFAFEYATKNVHYTRWSCCESKFTESDHTFENGKCTVCELEEGNQGDLAGMEPGTGTDYDVVPNPGFGAGRNPVTGTISIIAVITASVVSAFAGKAATKKRRRRI